MKFQFVSAAGVLLAVLAVTGCKSTSLNRYVAPRVMGRVIDSQSGQPIANARVQRASADARHRSMEPPKGAQMLETPPTAVSGPDGRFELESLRSLTPFGRIDFYSVTVSFEHPDYRRFATNYTLSSVTNEPGGEPVIRTGDVPLARRSK